MLDGTEDMIWEANDEHGAGIGRFFFKQSYVKIRRTCRPRGRSGPLPSLNKDIFLKRERLRYLRSFSIKVREKGLRNTQIKDFQKQSNVKRVPKYEICVFFENIEKKLFER